MVSDVGQRPDGTFCIRFVDGDVTSEVALSRKGLKTLDLMILRALVMWDLDPDV